MKMKRTLLLISLCCIIMLTGCQCKHEEWSEATCTTPKTCNACGETEGTPLGHDWTEATCEKLKTCKVCNETEGELKEHTWVSATCTSPKTCTVCGATEGEKDKHIWQDATCTEPKTCKFCKITEGEALGHTMTEWTTTAESSCTVAGSRQRNCKICNKTFTEALPLKEHTAGTWSVTKEATATSSGEKSLTCSVCGYVMKTEKITLSAEEIKKQYIAKCSKYSYGEIARNPNAYDGKYAVFTGEVIQVQQEEAYGFLVYVLRVDVTKTGRYYEDTVYVTYIASMDEPRILEDDIITMYGELTGEKTYQTIFGASVTIPSFSAEYIDIN